MPIESDTDRLEALKALGEPAMIDGNEVYGVFERAYSGLPFDSEVADTEPQLYVRAIDVEDTQKGGVVDVSGERFKVASKEPDGTGMVILRLVEA